MVVTHGRVLVDGLREEIIYILSAMEDVNLVTHISSDMDENLNVVVRKSSKKVKVDYILAGNGQIINGKARIRLHLINAKSNGNLWSKPYEGIIDDINTFELQQEIAAYVAEELKTIISE